MYTISKTEKKRIHPPGASNIRHVAALYDALFKAVVLLTCVLLSACSGPHLKPQNPVLPSGNIGFNQEYIGFDKASVLFAAGIANASYEYDLLTARKSLMDDPRYQMTCVDLVFIANTDRRVLIAARHDFAFISINGTESFRDWYNDAKFMPYESLESGGGQYANLISGHGGFRRLYSEAREGISEAIKRSPCMSRNIRNIYYSGHSLGAGLGIIAAKDFCQKKDFCFSGMFLFAPPLTARADVYEDNDAFKKNKVISIQNYKDYVTRGGLRGTFVHPGRFYVLKDGAITEKPQDEKFIKYTTAEKIKLKIIEDHRMKNYISVISALP